VVHAVDDPRPSPRAVKLRGQPCLEPIRPCLFAAAQAGDEIGVFSRVDSALEHLEQPVEILAHKCGGIEPQAREYRASQDTVAVRRKLLEPVIPQNEPIDLTVKDTLHDVLADVIALVSGELPVEIVADRAGGNLGDQIGRTLDVTVHVDPHLAAMLRPDEQDLVGLGRVADVQAYRGIIGIARTVHRTTR
jgi:hypothetical protein